jgi:hypothetical protein
MNSNKENNREFPPSVAMMQMVTGFWVSSAIYVAAKLGLADHLGGGSMDVDELAQRVGADSGALYRLLRALASVEVFTEVEPRRFALTQKGNYLRSSVPGSLRAFSIVGREIGWEPWGQLLHSVRTGETAFDHLHGMGYFEFLKQNPELARLFDEAMTGFVTMNGLAVAAAYDFTPFSTIVDVGGGHGVLISTILKQNKQARAIVFDRPDVVEVAKNKLASAGVANRCECIGGDFFVSIPSGGDAYLLASVLHDWDDEKSLAILRNCRHAMSTKAKLLLVEMVIPQGDASFFGKLLDLNMLVNLGGRERTEEEYRNLLSAAGFQLSQLVQTRTPSSLIEAHPV